MPFPWQPHSIDSPCPIRVLILGAGPNGITSAIRLLQKVPSLSLTIYDKNASFGGTWFETRYPSVGADIPALSYQLTFEPNREWSSMYPPGDEICRYWQGIAEKYGLRRYARFGCRVTHMEWDEKTGKWRLEGQTTTGDKIVDEGDWTFLCLGQYNNWKWPDIPSRESYKGQLIHSATWDIPLPSLEGKRIALIGSGSSAVQIVPKIQALPNVHIDTYIRNQMWLSPPFGADYILSRAPELASTNFVIPPSLRQKFLEDDDFYFDWRRGMEKAMNSLHGVTMLDHPLQTGFREYLTRDMKEKLKEKPEIYNSLLPEFPVCCRRVTPDNGFLNTLVQKNVTFRSEEIVSFTPRGLSTANNENQEYDIIICATGYNGTFHPPFPILGTKSLNLQSHLTDPPKSYLSLAFDSFPNLLQFAGPNSEPGTSHSMVVFETLATYATKCILKAQFEQIKSMAPSTHAVTQFSRYVDCYFSKGRTVYGEEGCRSGYRNGRTEGVSSALWPGSVLHFRRTLKEPRWQDWEYVYRAERDAGEGGLFGYLGDGWTEAEKREGGDVTYYLDEIDVPEIPSVTSVKDEAGTKHAA